MNVKKVNIKKWIKDHKKDLITSGIILATGVAGTFAGKKIAEHKFDKYFGKLGDMTYFTNTPYTLSELGKAGLDSLADSTCPDGLDENSKMNAVMFFYNTMENSNG